MRHTWHALCGVAALAASVLVGMGGATAGPPAPAAGGTAASANAASPDAAHSVPSSAGVAAVGIGPRRIDFDERLIKGQTAQAGSVTIFQRQALGDQALARRVPSLRGRIIRGIFGVSQPRAGMHASQFAGPKE